ncbi:hypothetical protein [Myxococcus sp. CA039A]|uniref:hypothetical protein n=1 Tax=Myxococcus sp. CA039A TaxID=2741737 RepID=UPI00157B03A4|nr:hypothetical protein [Myxococcus sp. CA039A]NTX53237.1 hypothetical protein [Myxococcus sp. CA039A]
MRRLTLSLERIAAHGLTSGAIQGASEGLQAELPGLDGQLRQLIQDAVALLAREVEVAAERPRGSWSRSLVESAVQGVVAELRRSMPGADALSHDLLERVNGWLDHSAKAADQRQRELRQPGARARTLATGAVRGAVLELEHEMPVLAPIASEVASQAGRGLVEGLSTALDARTERLDEVLEQVGRRFIHAVVGQLELELKEHRERSDVGVVVATMAERTATATVRGASEELRRQLRTTRDELGNPSLRSASREVTLGVFSALSERLRMPLAVAMGAGGALMLTAFTLARRR